MLYGAETWTIKKANKKKQEMDYWKRDARVPHMKKRKKYRNAKISLIVYTKNS